MSISTGYSVRHHQAGQALARQFVSLAPHLVATLFKIDEGPCIAARIPVLPPIQDHAAVQRQLEITRKCRKCRGRRHSMLEGADAGGEVLALGLRRAELLRRESTRWRRWGTPRTWGGCGCDMTWWGRWWASRRRCHPEQG